MSILSGGGFCFFPLEQRNMLNNRILNIREVTELTSLSTPTLRRWIAADGFARSGPALWSERPQSARSS